MAGISFARNCGRAILRLHDWPDRPATRYRHSQGDRSAAGKTRRVLFARCIRLDFNNVNQVLIPKVTTAPVPIFVGEGDAAAPPRGGTMSLSGGEIACPLGPVVSLTTRPTNRLFHLVLEPHDGRALVPIPKRSTSPWATSSPL